MMNNHSKQTILIVDDEPINLAILNKMLTDDYKVRAANSGKRALQIVVTDPRPDLILLDIMMPEMDGYEVLRQLKKNPVTENIPVIFFTAMNANDDEETGLAIGAVDYITKPLRPGILLARVKTQLILKQASDFLHDKNEYLEKEIAHRMKENQIIQNMSICALAHLAETRDTDTGGHILRTQSYVQIMAKHLQKHPKFQDILTEHFIELLTKSAPLHDIGKVGIPDNILLKPGKLTHDEYQIMKTHTTLGAQSIERAEKEIGQPIEFLSLAKEIALWHHERWDGNGYPDGLAGEAIPISARLMALADVFDALIMRRVYKKPMPLEEAKAIIKAERNRQFDPDITDAFIASFEQLKSIAQKHQDDI